MTVMPSQIEAKDRTLLNIIQSAFPLVERPFREIGSRLGVSEGEVIGRIRALKEKKVVRQISAIFDTRRLGYKSTLVAMRLPPERLDRGARVINRHPGVSHNYARDHYYNLWFTMAVPPDGDAEMEVRRLGEKAAAEGYHVMPAVRFFKIGVNFDMETGESASLQREAGRRNGDASGQVERLTPLEVRVVRELQEDISLAPEPFQVPATRLGVTQAQFLEMARSFQEREIMRRFGAVLNHRKAGFSHNAMSVWVVPDERAEEVGKVMASFKVVSHCYQRPIFHDWPYSHFAMLHATSREGCEEVARQISEKTGIMEFTLLYSTREFKKSRVRYFE